MIPRPSNPLVTAIDVSDALARIGASYSGRAGADSSVFALSTLRRFADRGAALLAALVTSPSLREDDTERVRKHRLDRLPVARRRRHDATGSQHRLASGVVTPPVVQPSHLPPNTVVEVLDTVGLPFGMGAGLTGRVSSLPLRCDGSRLS